MTLPPPVLVGAAEPATEGCAVERQLVTFRSAASLAGFVAVTHEETLCRLTLPEALVFHRDRLGCPTMHAVCVHRQRAAGEIVAFTIAHSADWDHPV